MFFRRLGVFIRLAIWPQEFWVLSAIKTINYRAATDWKVIMKIFWYTGILPLVERMISLNHQFKEDSEFLKYTDDNGIEQYREVFMDDLPYDRFLIRPAMSFVNPGLAKDVRQQSLNNFALGVSQTPAAQYISWRDLAKSLIEAYDLESEDILLDDEEVQAQAQQLLMGGENAEA